MTAGYHSLQAIAVDMWPYDEWLPEGTLKIFVKKIIYVRKNGKITMQYFRSSNLIYVL